MPLSVVDTKYTLGENDSISSDNTFTIQVAKTFNQMPLHAVEAYSVVGYQKGQEFPESDAWVLRDWEGAGTDGLVWFWNLTYEKKITAAVTNDGGIIYRDVVDKSLWTKQRVLYYDAFLTDSYKTNVLGEPLPPMVRDEYFPEIRYTKVESSPKSSLDSLAGKINNAEIDIAGTTIKQYHGMFLGVHPQRFVEEGTDAVKYRNTYIIRIDNSLPPPFGTIHSTEGAQGGFKEYYLNASFNHRWPDGEGGYNPPIRNIRKDGTEYDEPLPIDLNGVPIVDPDTGALTGPPIWIERVPYDQADFSTLGLSTSYPS